MNSNASTETCGIEPEDRPVAGDQQAGPSQGGKAARNLGILLVEDESAHAARMEKALGQLGHRVLGRAMDGQAACQCCLELRPDLVLMDQSLPKMDGLQAAFVMNCNQPVPVLLMAAQIKEGLKEEALQAGVYACLPKPVDATLLDYSIDIAFRCHQRLCALQAQIEDLRNEISARKLVGRASGILMLRHHLTYDQAVGRLHERAMALNQPLIEAASKVIEDDQSPTTAG